LTRIKWKLDISGPTLAKTWNKQLQESGLQLGILKESRQNTVVPKFKNCVLFFTKNEKGQIIDIYGRSINPNGEGKHFYLSGKHQGIYPSYPECQNHQTNTYRSLYRLRHPGATEKK
jgi:hypothetical protein